MRLDPLAVALKQDFRPEKIFYFISGNEKTFIQKINTKIVEAIKKMGAVRIINIETINDFVDETSMFEDKKIVLIKSCKDLNQESLNKVRNSKNIFIFSQENSLKIKKLKNIFLNDKDSYLIDCYELDKNLKIKVLNEFIKLHEKDIDENIYWFLIEKLDNKYPFLENSLNQILGLDQKDINLLNIKKIISNDSSGKERVFFNLYKKNKEIIEVYREKITTNSDVNEFYYYCKSFCQLIIDSNNEQDYTRKIPVYLFKEKNFLIDIYRKFNSRKKKMLLKLLLSTEKILRKENEISLISGLRFFLNIKKITIS